MIVILRDVFSRIRRNSPDKVLTTTVTEDLARTNTLVIEDQYFSYQITMPIPTMVDAIVQSNKGKIFKPTLVPGSPTLISDFQYTR